LEAKERNGICGPNLNPLIAFAFEGFLCPDTTENKTNGKKALLTHQKTVLHKH